MRKFLIALLTLCFTLGSFVCLTGCGEVNLTYSKMFFNSEVNIVVKGYSNKISCEEEITSTLTFLDNTFSLSKTGSLANRFNNLTLEDEPITLTEEENQVFSTIYQLNTLHEKFNITIYPLVELWGFNAGASGKTEVPEDSEIQSALELVGTNKILYNQQNKTLTKTENGVKIDFGGVLKGYAVDVITNILKDNGYTDGYISIGGSSISILETTSKLSIVHPENVNDNVLQIENHLIKNKKLSTSGTYRKFYEIAGVKYSHVIDVSTGKPIDTGFTSITLIADNGAKLDALSTALLTLTKEELISYFNQNLSNYTIFAIYNKNGEKKVLTNLENDFTLLDSSYQIEKI
ncbi:MAG: FAD:protein FMN transferase [Clostridia bacterium]|nr:FAD:protein FMN transferase [Clostridia bacterium]